MQVLVPKRVLAFAKIIPFGAIYFPFRAAIRFGGFDSWIRMKGAARPHHLHIQIIPKGAE